jgi:hypothetical protein
MINAIRLTSFFCIFLLVASSWCGWNNRKGTVYKIGSAQSSESSSAVPSSVKPKMFAWMRKASTSKKPYVYKPVKLTKGILDAFNYQQPKYKDEGIAQEVLDAWFESFPLEDCKLRSPRPDRIKYPLTEKQIFVLYQEMDNLRAKSPGCLARKFNKVTPWRMRTEDKYKMNEGNKSSLSSRLSLVESCSTILSLKNKSKKPVTLKIYSSGSDISTGDSFFNCLCCPCLCLKNFVKHSFN